MKDEHRSAEQIALDLLHCVMTWEPSARLFGNIRADEIAYLASRHITSCPKCGAEPWVNVDCGLCEGISLLEKKREPQGAANARDLSTVSFDELMARSSLGEPDVVEAVASVPAEVADEIVRRANRLINEPLAVFRNSVFDMVIAHDEADALEVLGDVVGADVVQNEAHRFHRVPGHRIITVVGWDESPTGKTTKTAREWAEIHGRGLLHVSTEADHGDGSR